MALGYRAEMQLRELSKKKEAESAAGMWSGQEAQRKKPAYFIDCKGDGREDEFSYLQDFVNAALQ